MSIDETAAIARFVSSCQPEKIDSTDSGALKSWAKTSTVLTAWNPALMHLEKIMDWVVNMSMLSITPSCRETRHWKLRSKS